MPWCTYSPRTRAHYVKPGTRRYICGIRWGERDKVVTGKAPEGLEPCPMCKKIKQAEAKEK